MLKEKQLSSIDKSSIPPRADTMDLALGRLGPQLTVVMEAILLDLLHLRQIRQKECKFTRLTKVLVLRVKGRRLRLNHLCPKQLTRAGIALGDHLLQPRPHQPLTILQIITILITIMGPT